MHSLGIPTTRGSFILQISDLQSFLREGKFTIIIVVTFSTFYFWHKVFHKINQLIVEEF